MSAYHIFGVPMLYAFIFMFGAGVLALLFHIVKLTIKNENEYREAMRHAMLSDLRHGDEDALHGLYERVRKEEMNRADWDKFNSVAESLKRQEAAERNTVENVCSACGVRTVNGICSLCGSSESHPLIKIELAPMDIVRMMEDLR